jgi:hypothetical protein
LLDLEFGLSKENVLSGENIVEVRLIRHFGVLGSEFLLI